MAKLLLFAVLVGWVAIAFAQPQEGSTGEPVVYDLLKRAGFGHILDFLCTVKQLLQDRDVSDRLYKMVDGVREFFKDGFSCGKEIIFKALSDQSTNIGKLASAFGFDKDPANTTPTQGFPRIIFTLPNILKGIDGFQIGEEFLQLARQALSNCGIKSLDVLENDFQFIIQKYEDYSKKASGGSSGNENTDG